MEKLLEVLSRAEDDGERGLPSSGLATEDETTGGANGVRRNFGGGKLTG